MISSSAGVDGQATSHKQNKQVRGGYQLDRFSSYLRLFHFLTPLYPLLRHVVPLLASRSIIFRLASKIISSLLLFNKSDLSVLLAPQLPVLCPLASVGILCSAALPLSELCTLSCKL